MFDGRHLLLLIATFCCGCGINGVTAISGKGDSVTNQGGLGTGTVAGVNIEVQGLKQKNAGVTHSVHIAQGIESTSESDRWEVAFGEVELVLQRDNNQPATLTINGQGYGTVAKGDELLIDADRNVSVDGKPRVLQ